MWNFHISLSAPNDYSAAPWGLLLQLRPTVFFDGWPAGGGAASGSQAFASVGNPMLWCGGALALLLVFAMWLWWSDGRAGLILAAIGAGWLPWFIYGSRTIFTFYAVVFAPFMALALVYAVSLITRTAPGVSAATVARRRRQSFIVLAVVCCFAMVLAVFFYPIWAAEVIPYEQWRWRMWLPSWI